MLVYFLMYLLFLGLVGQLALKIVKQKGGNLFIE